MLQSITSTRRFQLGRSFVFFIATDGVRLFSKKNEEYHIAKAMRSILELEPEITVQIERVQLVGCNMLPSAAEHVIASSKVRIKCLTHADTISDAALRQQIVFAEEQERAKYPNQHPPAIFALNLKEEVKAKNLKELRDALFGASFLVNSQLILVCGLPNSGKSSLILPLTKQRTMLVRKKKSFHLPKVSNVAGMTLALKKHVLEYPTNSELSVTLIDSPGLRPQLERTDARAVALLLAANVVMPFAGSKTTAPPATILHLLLQAANRHANMSNEQPAYMEILGLDSPTEDPAIFLKAFRDGQPDLKINDMAVIRMWHSGEFGELIFTSYRELPKDPNPTHSFRRKSPIVYMNETAHQLGDIGRGTAL